MPGWFVCLYFGLVDWACLWLCGFLLFGVMYLCYLADMTLFCVTDYLELRGLGLMGVCLRGLCLRGEYLWVCFGLVFYFAGFCTFKSGILVLCRCALLFFVVVGCLWVCCSSYLLIGALLFVDLLPGGNVACEYCGVGIAWCWTCWRCCGFCISFDVLLLDTTGELVLGTLLKAALRAF